MTQEALRMALEALENGDVPTPENVGKNLDAITAIKEALAQTQEPVAWQFKRKEGGRSFVTSMGHVDDFKSEPFVQLLLEGIAWALGRE